MSSWLQKRRSPRPSASPHPDMVGSGSPGPVEVRLHCDEGGLKNPMDWGTVPTALQEKFPHWKKTVSDDKQSSQVSLGRDMDPSIHFSSSFKAPDFTIPYMVMDRDTLNSIAIKFETTPGDIARINRKHQGPSWHIFPGDVIYVPDTENMPKPPSPSPPPPPESPPPVNNERGVTPLNWATDVEEEVTDTHLSIVCKFMSDDQGCIHGSLVLNHMALMFTPHLMDPLVMELGAMRFEIVLPIVDITYAALTKDAAPPTRRSQTHISEGSSDGRVTISENSVELDLSLDKIIVSDDLQNVPVITFSRASLNEDSPASLDEDPQASLGKDPPASLDEDLPGSSMDPPASLEEEDTSERREDDATTIHNTSGDGELSIVTLKGDNDDPPASVEDPSASNSLGCPSCESLLSDEPVFLHVHVCPKPGTTYTYTPINSAVGIDIPKGEGPRSKRSPSVQQVKTCFCFAFTEKRAYDVVQFIKAHHPKPLTTPSLGAWTEGTFEFICSDQVAPQGLDFCEDHFDTSSWEIMSLQDLHKYRRRLSAMEDLDLPPPTLSEESQLLVEGHLKKLVAILPAAAVGRQWVLVYSTFRDGISLRTMYRNMVAFENEDSPVVLVVRDDQLKIFGAVTTCPVRISDKFYGRGESSLFSFESPTEMQHYYWTGGNHYFVKGNSTSLSIGSGDGHPGLWIDENFYHGSSYECSTFNNQCLASSQDFICTGVEAWGFL
ncbi:oxidation resistance protein 1-like isoform X2 [Halichondria panicea]|uniref:oxidation resistance protein 1-like isoform X2 n=1 Tax=Halichondria panicea TaxID=6063 RepID=UPI00312B5E7F